MKSLEEKKWGEFRIGDLYSVTRPAARNKDDYDDGLIPFVASGAENNGVMKFCSSKPDESLDKKNCITVSPVDGSSFYQAFDFLGRGGAGSSILMLYSDNNERLSGQFIARMIANTCSKYTYGHMGNKESIKREIILLPVTDDGEPDYEYMAEYIRQQQDSLLNKYRNYVSEKLQELGNLVEIPTLNEKRWDTFVLGDLAEIQSGRDIYADERVDGDTPYITSGTTNNGIGYFVSNDNDSRLKNAISVNRNGAVGQAFYHPYSALYGNDCRQVILHDCRNIWVQLFFTQTISKQKSAFSYSRKLGTTRLKNLCIMLPVDDTGAPDYEYMEQYVKNMMIKKYHQYLDYTEKH